VRIHGCGQYYQLDLFSNFTFFLNDPANGDEIEQSDGSRKVFGLDTTYERRDTPFGIPLKSSADFQFRSDRMRVVLANGRDRHLLPRTEDSDIFQTSYFPYVEFDAVPLSSLRLVTGTRGDAYVTLENVANVRWREAQFFKTSRLTGGPAEGVQDTVLGGLALRF